MLRLGTTKNTSLKLLPYFTSKMMPPQAGTLALCSWEAAGIGCSGSLGFGLKFISYLGFAAHYQATFLSPLFWQPLVPGRYEPFRTAFPFPLQTC